MQDYIDGMACLGDGCIDGINCLDMHRGPRTVTVPLHVLCSLHKDDESDRIMVSKDTWVMSPKVT